MRAETTGSKRTRVMLRQRLEVTITANGGGRNKSNYVRNKMKDEQPVCFFEIEETEFQYSFV